MSWRQATVAMAAVVMSTTVPTGSAFAADVNLSIFGETEYDDNLFRTSKGEVDDMIFRITPRTKIYDDEGKFNWSVEYWMPFERALNHSEVDDLNHYARVISEYPVSRKTTLTFFDRFWYSDDAGRSQDLSGESDFSLSSFREPVIRNHARLTIEHQFTPRTAGYAEFGHKLFHTDLRDRSNNQTFELNTRVMHQYRPQHRLGGGLSVSFQDFEKSNDDTRPESQDLFVNLFGAWTWFIDEKTTFEIVGGPTFIDSSQDRLESLVSNEPVAVIVGNLSQATSKGIRVSDFSSCSVTTVPATGGGSLTTRFVVLNRQCGGSTFLDPATDAVAIGIVESLGTINYEYDLTGADPDEIDISSSDTSDTQWTFFGQASLTRRWTPHWTSTLSYTRRQSNASGIAGSAILDAVTLMNQLRLAERWWLDFRADFTLRQSTSETTQLLLRVVEGESIDTASGTFNLAVTTGELFQREVNKLLDTKRWGTTIRLRYRVNKNLWLSLRHIYTQQDSKSASAGNATDFTNQLLTFGVQYDFDRIHLW